jgi:hypothetical protein
MMNFVFDLSLKDRPFGFVAGQPRRPPVGGDR